MFHSFHMEKTHVYYGAIGLILLIVFLLSPNGTKFGASSGLELCYSVLIPSIFPALFAASLICRMLGLLNSRYTLPLLTLLSFFGGFPSGAKFISALVQSGTLDKTKGARLLAGCVNAGPAFLISAVGLGLFRNATVGIALFIALSFASVICLFLFYPRKYPALSTPTKKSLTSAAGFGECISDAVSSMLGICGCTVLFSSVRGALTPFFEEGSSFLLLFRLFGEVTEGCRTASNFGSIKGLFLAGAAVSLCGLSVWLQISGITSKSRVSLRFFFLSRPIHLFFTLLFLWLFTKIGGGIAVFQSFGGNAAEWFTVSPLFSLSLFGACAVFLVGKGGTSLFTKGTKDPIMGLTHYVRRHRS